MPKVTSTPANATRRFSGPFSDATNTVVVGLALIQQLKGQPVSRREQRVRSKRLRVANSEPKSDATDRKREVSYRIRGVVHACVDALRLEVVDTEVAQAAATVTASVPPVSATCDETKSESEARVVSQPSTCEDAKTAPAASDDTALGDDGQLAIYNIEMADVKYEPWSHPAGYTGYYDPAVELPFESGADSPTYYSNELELAPVQQHIPPPPLAYISIPSANILIPIHPTCALYSCPCCVAPDAPLLPRLIVRILPGAPKPKYYLGPDGQSVFEACSREDVLPPEMPRTELEEFYGVSYYGDENCAGYAMSSAGPVEVLTFRGGVGYPGASYIYYGV
ncbi:hypothetical protein R3P38DRAFT_3291872 [Favolaschia claudopus]|uniref:Uncharacterized protein n=1 Tax=Favolaschia claudopus TaxID=2862362 RepID=A0AAV9ZML1_9AGAR